MPSCTVVNELILFGRKVSIKKTNKQTTTLISFIYNLYKVMLSPHQRNTTTSKRNRADILLIIDKQI